MTGLPSVDVTSIGAGGGSIASVDEQGLLQVGPASAGAVPGPVCYGRGGNRPTVTDAALVLGLIDAEYFLGGKMKLNSRAAASAIENDIAGPLGLSRDEAASAILSLATENMVQAILDITVNQGIDPQQAVLIGGGGAAGLNMVAIGRRLNVKAVVIPPVGAVLSAAGALMSDLVDEYRATLYVHSRRFDFEAANATLADLTREAERFVSKHGSKAISSAIEYYAEARYPDQVWEIEVPLRHAEFRTGDEVKNFEADFHAMHQKIFAVCDPLSPVEIVGWTSRASCQLRSPDLPAFELEPIGAGTQDQQMRSVYFGGEIGRVDVPVKQLNASIGKSETVGPAIVESAFTSVVIDPGTTCRLSQAGSLIIRMHADPCD